MPGICGVIELERTAAGGAQDAEALLDRMADSLMHHPAQIVLHRLRIGPLHAAVVGYPSRVHHVLRTENGAAGSVASGPVELWYGEINEGRCVRPSGGADRAFVFADELSPPGSPAGVRLARISGSFAGLRFDPDGGRFEIFTDSIGSIPVCLRRQGGLLLFAPEVKGLLPYRAEELTGDSLALAFFLKAGYLPPGRSHFRQIRYLGPGSVCSGTASGTPGDGQAGKESREEPREERYWEFCFDRSPGGEPPGSDRSRRGLRDELVATLRSVIASHVTAGARTAVLLSGGYDSRGLLGAALATGLPISGVTWGQDPDWPGSDAVVARQLAAAAGIPHRFVKLDASELPRTAARWVWMTDGVVDNLDNYPQGDGVFRDLAEDFDVIIRGDECFGMKWPYGIPDEASALACVGLYPLHWHAIWERLIGDEFYAFLLDQDRAGLPQIQRVVRSERFRDRKDEYYFNVRFQAQLNRLNYFKAQCLAVRNPLLDRRILELALRIPGRLRRSKALFREAVQTDLAPFPDIPFASRTSLISWRRVAAEDPGLRRLFRERLLEAPGSMRWWLRRPALERQLDEWLSPPAGEGGGAPPVRSPWRERMMDLGKRIAYQPWAPDFLRRRIVPPRSNRRPMTYAFRLLTLSLYLEALESRGIRIDYPGTPDRTRV